MTDSDNDAVDNAADEVVVEVEADSITLSASSVSGTGSASEQRSGDDVAQTVYAVAPVAMSDTENKMTMQTGNRLLEIPSHVTEQLYALATRVLRDDVQGFDMLLCRSSNALAVALIEAVYYNELGFNGWHNTGGISKPMADVLASKATVTRNVGRAWIVYIEADKPKCWLRGWISADVLLREQKRQVIMLEAGLRQMELEVGG